MEPENSTTYSCASGGLREAVPPSLELDLPEGDSFRSLPSPLPLVEMMRRSRQLRLWFPAGLPSEEERWRAKRPAEFHL